MGMLAMDDDFDRAEVIEEAFHLDDADATRALASCVECVSFEAGERIFECGTTARRLFLILTGEVDLRLPVDVLPRERGVRIDRVGAGAVIGWSALTENSRYVLSAWAVGPVEALAWTSGKIRDWSDANPRPGLRFQSKISSVIGGRLASTIAALRGEIEHSVRQKRRGAYD